MSIGGVELAVLVAVMAALLIRSRRRWDPVTWAREMGVDYTARNEGLIRTYLARTKSLRLAGAIVGFAVPHVYEAYRGVELPVPFDWDLIDALVGYLVGAVVAELTIRRPKADVPTASLQHRKLNDYLPPLLTKMLRAAAAGGLVLVFLYHILPSRESVGDELPPAIVIGSAMLVVLLGVELLQRYVVKRPQPVAGDDVVQADDAIRSASVHALAAAGIAFELIMASVHIAGIGFESNIQLLRWTLPWIAGACFVLALGSWARVARPHKRRGWHPRGAIA